MAQSYILTDFNICESIVWALWNIVFSSYLVQNLNVENKMSQNTRRNGDSLYADFM